MGPDGYLPRLTARLADGVAGLPPESRRQHTRYLLAAQGADGGFPGREGGSDLYYTGFALRGLAALDELTPETAARAASFLRDCLARQASVVDFYSLLYSCVLLQAATGEDVLAGVPPGWPERVAATLETFRTADGGYGKSAGAAGGSTYHTFLVGLCHELLGRPLPDADAAVRFVAARRRDDGGFVEVAPMRRGGTNPTAAAVGLLRLLEEHESARALLAEVKDGVTDFLADMASMEGGMRANGRAPLADLLSTFTAAWTLDELGARQRIDAASAVGFARSLEADDGGFRGGLWDDGRDVEYTFYGLGVLALLAKR